MREDYLRRRTAHIEALMQMARQVGWVLTRHSTQTSLAASLLGLCSELGLSA